MREELVGDAHMRARFVDLAQRDQAQAIFGMLDIDDRAIVFAHDLGHRQVASRGRGAELLAVRAGRILILEKPMQIRRVRRIDADFECLQPVAAPVALEREGVTIRRDERIDLRECRRLAFAEIGPEYAGFLDHGIGALPDALAQL